MNPRRFLPLVAPLLSVLPMSLAAQTLSPPCKHIQLRFVDTVYVLGVDAAPLNAPRVYRSSADGWSYALVDTVVFDERAIASVAVQSMRLGSDTAWVVDARTTADGARALSDATASHVGRHLGIVIGDDLVNTPRIESQLFGTAIELRGPAPRAVADSIASLVRGAIDPSCRPPLAPSTAYFEFQVSKPVSVVPGNVPPIYPTVLREAKVSGGVVVQFIVDTLGRAEMLTFHVLRSTDSLFTKAVESALPRYQFIPAEIAGRRVRQIVQMPFEFNFTPGPAPVPPKPPDSVSSGPYRAITPR